MISYFVFGARSPTEPESIAGRSSLDLCLTVEHKDVLGGAEPDFDDYEPPGRDGTVFISRNRRKNVSVLYETYLKAPSKQDLPRYVGDIKRWLQADPCEYRRLEDTYDPEHYRLAVYRGGFNAEEVIRGYTRQDIEFSCLPYRYRKAGDFEQALTAGQTLLLHNDTGFTALPLIRIERSTGTDSDPSYNRITIQYGYGVGETCTITNTPPGVFRLWVSSEEKRLYMASESGQTQAAVIDKFPELAPGNVPITVTGFRVRSAAIAPRWREL